VESGIDPKRVLDLLVEISDSQSNVLREPKPVAYLLGFGSNALNYELQFWVPQAGTLLQVKSELSLKVAAALRAFAQEELKAKSSNNSAAD